MEESSQKTQQNNTDMEHIENYQHASAVQTAPLFVLPEPTMLDNYGKSHENNPDHKFTFIIDCLMFICIVISTENFWIFPQQVMKNGGLYFLFIYFTVGALIAVPLFHLEIFVGQFTQAGIMKAFKMYGYGFEGIGMGILYLTVLFHIKGMYETYSKIRHINYIWNDPISIVTCNNSWNSDNCGSIYMDYLCALKNSSFPYSVGRKCDNSLFNVTTAVIPAAVEYVRHLIEEEDDFKMDYYLTIIIQYIVIAAIAVWGPVFCRLFLAGTMSVSLILLSLLVIKFTIIGNMREGFHALLVASNPEAILCFQNWISAVKMVISSSGIGFKGIFCASSFRNKRSDSFTLTRILAWTDFMMSLIGLVMLLSGVSRLRAVTHLTTSYTADRQSIEFSGSVISEVFSLEKNPRIWILCYNVLMYIFDFTSIFGSIYLLYAFVRDTFENRRRWMAIGVTAYCCANCIIFILATAKASTMLMETLMFKTSDFSSYLYIAMTVFVFVHVYGYREFFIDLCSIFKEKEGWSTFFTPMSPAHVVVFKAVPVILLMHQIDISISMWTNFLETASYLAEIEEFLPLFKVCLNMLVSFIPLLLTTGFFCYHAWHLRMGTMTYQLVFPTPQHPSYWRITSTADSNVSPSEGVIAQKLTEELNEADATLNINEKSMRNQVC